MDLKDIPTPPLEPPQKIPFNIRVILPLVVMVAALPFLAKSVRERQLTNSQAKIPPNTYCVATLGCPTATPLANHAPQFVKFPPVSAAHLNTLWQLTISARDVDSQDTLNMEATGFPPGITIGSCVHQPGTISCTIQGQTTDSGLFNPIIVATDNHGSQTLHSFTLLVI